MQNLDKSFSQVHLRSLNNPITLQSSDYHTAHTHPHMYTQSLIPRSKEDARAGSGNKVQLAPPSPSSLMFDENSHERHRESGDRGCGGATTTTTHHRRYQSKAKIKDAMREEKTRYRPARRRSQADLGPGVQVSLPFAT